MPRPVVFYPDVEITRELVSLFARLPFFDFLIKSRVSNHSKGLNTIFLTLVIMHRRLSHNSVVGVTASVSFFLGVHLLSQVALGLLEDLDGNSDL